MTIFRVISRVVVDKEHGVTNKFEDVIISTSEEKAKETHKKDLQQRFGDNPFYGGVFKQDVTTA